MLTRLAVWCLLGDIRGVRAAVLGQLRRRGSDHQSGASQSHYPGKERCLDFHIFLFFKGDEAFIGIWPCQMCHMFDQI